MKNDDNSIDINAENPSGKQNISEKETLDLRIHNYQKQLRRLSSELSLAETRERREIASDLHDHIGQALAFVTQKINLLRGNAIFSGMEKDLEEIHRILEQTIRYIRNLTVEISPPVLYELGLSASIDWIAERFLERHKLKVISSQRGKPKEIAEDVKVFIFKAIQELLINITKHAGACYANITANWGKDDFEIVVSDDGLGFDTKTLSNEVRENNCFGLFSIRERLSYIGGSLKIESLPGTGTKVAMVAPYKISEKGRND